MDNYGVGFRAPKVDVHSFAMVPRADIPRSSFRMQHQHKTTFSASNLIPIFLEEVLPGDSWKVQMSAFVRMATPIYPVMDNLDLETWFFFVPNRLVWIHWYKFMGEQDVPGDSIAFNIPAVVSPANGFAQKTIFDYYGLPCVGQTGVGNQISVSALPFRGYNLIWNNWFRDQNLTTGLPFGSTSGSGYISMDDGPDPIANYGVQKVAKRHDMFTSCLPWTQKGGVAVTIPFVGNATVKTNASALFTGVQQAVQWQTSAGANVPNNEFIMSNTANNFQTATTGGTGAGNALYPTNLYADLSTAAAATINALRLAFQTQKLLERDARGGTRYPEIIKSHFGVLSPDARQMRPEFLGSGRSAVTFAPVPQTTATGLTGGSTPIGTLSGVGIAQGRNHGFSYAATEHGYIHGLAAVRQDMIYQQGIRRHWKRLTRYDFYFPVFAMLGERAVFNYEIFSDGSANDALVFGYNENWVEYRTRPSYTSAYFRSTNTTPLDSWHLAEKFTALPTLNNTFILDSTSNQVQRAVAAGAAAQDQQFLADFFFDAVVARVMPAYSVPGLIDHF